MGLHFGRFSIGRSPQGKPRWQRWLQRCDFDLAASVLWNHLGENPVTGDLAVAAEVFLGDPNYDHAVELVRWQPDLILLFRECHPGGQFHRPGRL